VTVLTFQFTEPSAMTALRNLPGVYMILDRRGSGWSVVDVGESEDVRNRVSNHDRAACWRVNSTGGLAFAAYYMVGSTEQYRRSVEKEIRDHYNPPCGKI
jgi:excinuclease UvrABC nuclease subunit